MTPDSSTVLLASLDRPRFGRVSVVRITPSGRATRRETLLDVEVLTRLWPPRMASLGFGARRGVRTR